MEFNQVFIIKRNGKREPFSVDKIKNAIQKAFFWSHATTRKEAASNQLPYYPWLIRAAPSQGSDAEWI